MNSKTEIIISPPKKWISINWKELWRYKDLFLIFTWRDISVRYKQTALGIIWVILQPLITMIIFTFIFNKVGKIDSGSEIPYPIFLFVGLLFWQYYSNTVTNASNSMVGNSGIIQKIYFPRLIIPTSTAISGLVDLFICGIILGIMMLFYGITPHLIGIIILPVLLLSTILTAMGFGMFLASFNVKYRDVRYALPFFIQILMYVTPVIYPIKMLDNHYLIKNIMICLNPMAGIIDNARSSIIGNGTLNISSLFISLSVSIIYFFTGLFYFRNTERNFADIV